MPEVPKQSDSSSCGIYVCLYIRQIITQCLVKSSSLQDQQLRKFISHEVLTICFFDQLQPFGLKEIMLCEDLDDFIHQILIADKNSKGPQFLRHQIFLCDPLAFTLLIHFGKDFFSEETKAAMILHLHKRYFGTRKQNKTKIFAPKVSYVKCLETTVLNNVLC